MLGDPWPEEPDDPFEEYARPFPEYGEPSPPRHAARIAARRAGDESASPRQQAVQTAFVALLPLVRIGIFALALGVLLSVFHGPGPSARFLTILGVLSCLYGGYRYLVYRQALTAAERER
jgi:hypothetical protein